MIKVLQLNNIISQQPITKRSAEGILSFKLNQLITARILEIFPDQTAKILYDGTALHAKLDAPLAKGNQYLFEVAEKSGTIVLKKVDVDPVKSSVEQILHKWNLPATETNKAAIDFAFLEKIPLTKENFIQVRDILKLSAEFPLQEKKAIVTRMIELMLPAKMETVQSVAKSLRSTSSFIEMKTLFETLVPFMHKNQQIAKTVNLLQHIYGFESKGSSSKGVPAASFNQQRLEMQSVADDLSQIRPAPQETKTLLSGSKELPDMIHVSKKEETVLTKEMKRQPVNEFLQAVEKWLRKSGLMHEKNLLLNPLQVKHEETLKSQLLYLQQHADFMELPEHVLSKTEQALTKLTSQQLQNVQMNDNIQQFNLQIPFSQNENPKEITVRWEGKKQSGNRLNPDHCRMLFWLEMKNLKEVAVDVQIQNRVVSLRVFNSHPFIEKLSGPLIATLKKSMKEMNYTLSSVTFAHNPKEVNHSKKPASYKGLDLRV